MACKNVSRITVGVGDGSYCYGARTSGGALGGGETRSEATGNRRARDSGPRNPIFPLDAGAKGYGAADPAEALLPVA